MDSTKNPISTKVWTLRYLPNVRLEVAAIFLLVIAGAGINVYQNLSVDDEKLPDKVEHSDGFQRWITNLKNKGMDFVEADEFRFIEENEIYNTKWLTISSLDEDGKQEEFENTLKAHLIQTDVTDELTPIKGVIFAPNENMFIDYRNGEKDGYDSNEARLYGLKEDKIIDARILDCSIRANCYFDRAYFLSNDVFVVSEFSRAIDKKDKDAPICTIDQKCTYSIKLHLIDLINNKRWVYESESFDIILTEWIPDL